MNEDGKELINIINAEMERRNLSIREFARFVGVSHPTISNVLNGGKPSFELCEKLAPVLRISLVSVLNMAGLIPSVPEKNELKEEINHLIDQLPPGDQQEMLELLRFKVERKATIKVTSRKKSPARSV